MSCICATNATLQELLTRMTHAYILTIDVGTSSTKAALWSERGEVIGESTVAYSLGRPSPVAAEIDALR